MNLQNLSTEQLLAFTSTLTTLKWQKLTDDDFKKIDKFVKSDGCSGVPDFYRNGCVIHDFYYRTHRNLNGSQITRRQADSVLRRYIMSKSPFGHFSPMAWWRYKGVRALAGKAWTGDNT